MNKNLFKIGSLAVVAIAMASCAKTDLYDENSEILISQHKADYQANFVKKYGEVDPNKSWDMSSNEPRYSLTPIYEASKASTRTAATYSKSEEIVTIGQSTLSWFFENTPAGKNNRKKGDPFYVDIAEGSFTIVPIFQGNASYYWELWMHVDELNEDIQIWKKGDDLKYTETEGGELKTVGTEQSGIPRNAFQVSAPAITFSGLPEGSMHFYLRMWKSTEKYTNDIEKSHYTQLSSLKQRMIVMKDFTKPSFVPSDVSYKIIGCEDANDNDYEDLAFLIYGNFGINEPVKVYEEIPKRYMVEDLGSTDDFDFNDVVVDVWNSFETIYNYELINGEKSLVNTTGPTLIKQWAIVRAAGGTIDFTIKIGNSTTWTKSQHVDPVTTMVNTGRNGAIDYQNKIIDQFDIVNKDWDSANNNIKIEVDGRGKNLGVYNIPFPKKGEIPMILAVDTSVNWMYERDGVPESWIDNTQPEHKKEDYPD